MAASAQAETARVPAWKRLGLKLKYAKDNPAQAEAGDQYASNPSVTGSVAPSHAPAAPPVNSQKRALEPDHSSTPAKRTKVEKSKSSGQQKPFPGSAPKTKTAGQQVWEDDERSSLPGPKGVFKAPGQAAKRIVFGDDDKSTQQAQNPPTPPKDPRPTTSRKSVSFTPDTKQEDSFSAQNLFKAWSSGEDPAESAVKESTEQPASPSASAKQPKQKKAKKTAKEAANRSTAEPAVSGEVPSYLRYLEQFANDKSNWKFSKNRQNDLFKHLFDINRIPSKYNSSLVEYISTTQGQARRRLAEQAEEILQAIWVGENENADQMSLDSPAERRLAYYEALQASINRYQESGSGRTQYGDEQLREILREHERGKRAELCLKEALSNELVTDKSSTPSSNTSTGLSATSTTIPRATRVVEIQKTAPGQITTTEVTLNHGNGETGATRKRKRKSRTDVSSSSESDSSSSDDSSDSSSDESDSPAPKKKKPSPTKELPPLFDTAVLDKKFGKPATYTPIVSKGTDKGKGRARRSESSDESSDEDSDSD
ncbi:hypothetical protein CKM354_000621900 [Cercospora kikuchii]|uniref:WKF domain-containing protein n=1 Tax=Cercospora kikuchii TaxID=84275 RepID=A0A9P3CGU1_9PEZI|nr:uncharacterized protein CKM354_000621900 [Cercospora kikuchii]GIZ42972.1 hypothetical protein CKM354_000621900 [Cercospora kikuchii]